MTCSHTVLFYSPPRTIQKVCSVGSVTLTTFYKFWIVSLGQFYWGHHCHSQAIWIKIKEFHCFPATWVRPFSFSLFALQLEVFIYLFNVRIYRWKSLSAMCMFVIISWFCCWAMLHVMNVICAFWRLSARCVLCAASLIIPYIHASPKIYIFQ
jgi:hypothetical protein